MSAKRRPKPPPNGFAVMSRMRVLDDEWIYEGAAARERLQEAVPLARTGQAKKLPLIQQVLNFVLGHFRG